MMTAATGVMARLRDETSTHHAAAEGSPLEQALVAGTLPRDTFVDLLGQRYIVHRALEARLRDLAAVNPTVATILHEELYQTANLQHDLAHFGVQAEAVTPLPATADYVAALPRIAAAEPLALLGACYVFEGSKNGAHFIARRLRPAYGLGSGPGTRYLDPHGAQQRPLWMAFKARMDAADFAPAVQDAMVAAARMTFDAIGRIDAAVHAGAARGA